MQMFPDADYLANVCKFGERDQCRYLSSCGKRIGWSCERKSPLAPLIDMRVARGLQRETSINCEGLDWR